MSNYNVPKGWKLVPEEPTPEMIEAASGSVTHPKNLPQIDGRWTMSDLAFRARYQAAIAAAPAAPELVLADRQQRGGDVAAVLSQFLTGDGFIAACDIPHIVHALERYAAPVAAQMPKRLLYRLRKHADDDRNSAFARSTMREALQYLAAAQPAPDAALVEALNICISALSHGASCQRGVVETCCCVKCAIDNARSALAGKGGE